MWRWIKEEWEMAGIWARLMVPLGLVSVVTLLVLLIFSIKRDGEDVGEVRPDIADGEDFIDAPSLYEALGATDALPRMGPTGRSILERHFFAIGGVKRLASINSLLATGEIIFEDGRIHPMVMAKKRGGRIRVTLRLDNRRVVMVVTPDDAWRSINQAGRLVFVGDLSEMETDKLRRSSYVVSELFMAMLNTWTVKYLGEQAFNYKMCHCFEVKISDRSRIRFFIDPDSYLELGREDWVFDAEGELTITRFVNSDFLDVNGMKVPRKMETYENNVLIQTFLATDLELNPGILDSSFARPEVPELQLSKP